MRFWDSSAIIPLLADEPSRPQLLARLDEDNDMVVWWGTPVEIASALARREREGSVASEAVHSALAAVHALEASWHEILPTLQVSRTAERLLRVHALRAADSLQLAAALIGASHDPDTLQILCLDERLASAARREGFTVIGAD